MRIAVVGAGGFIGRHVYAALAAAGADVVAIGRSVPAGVPGEWIAHDVSVPVDDRSPLRGFEVVVFAAGGADHGLGDRDPVANLEQNCMPLLRCLQAHHGDLVVLSSQAVYSGLVGRVPEQVDHLTSMPYGLAKAVAETHAMLAGRRGGLRRVTVMRLMYAFGQGEAPRRLLPRLAASVGGGPTAQVSGGGRSLLNPLPVEFVAAVLATAAMESPSRPADATAVNLCHPAVWSVRDVVELATAAVGARAVVTDAPEPWPVTFYGDTGRFEAWLADVGLHLPDVRESLTEYLTSFRQSGNPSS